MPDIELRDYLAGQVIGAIISGYLSPDVSVYNDSNERCATTAYKVADAMLEARLPLPGEDVTIPHLYRTETKEKTNVRDDQRTDRENPEVPG